MRAEFKPAIDALQSDLAELEAKVAETKRAINRLCELAGVDALYADISEANQKRSASTISALRSDQFYGRVMTTAAREYLEMRQSANLGPATPREIYEALRDGGFKFDTKSEVNAMTGLRQTLRKNSSTFHKLPNGQYGLLAWYPKAKAGDDEKAKAKGRARRPKAVTRKQAKVSRAAKQQPETPKPVEQTAPVAVESSGESLSAKVLAAMSDGTTWTVDRLKTSDLGKIEGVDGRKLQGAILGLRSRGLIEKGEGNGWKIAQSQHTTH